jgi:hypothetical protein
MKTIENITIYKCDFCSKELKKKHAMISHEEKCDKNPKNCKHCHFCEHLSKVKKMVWFELYYGKGKDKEVEVFKCDKLDKFMYPYSIEKRDLPNIYPDTFGDQEPMPNKCDSFQEQTYFL